MQTLPGGVDKPRLYMECTKDIGEETRLGTSLLGTSSRGRTCKSAAGNNPRPDPCPLIYGARDLSGRTTEIATYLLEASTPPL